MVRKSARGITLMEMLIVVAIIALLVALLLPALLWVRNYSKRIHCASNLRQLYVVLQSYVQDYKEPPPMFVHVGSGRVIWDWEVLEQYNPSTRTLRICPSDPYEGWKTRDGNRQRIPVSYVLHYTRPLPYSGVDPERARFLEWFETIDPSNPEEIFISCEWHHADFSERVWAVFSDGRVDWAYARSCTTPEGRTSSYFRPIDLTPEQCRLLFP